MFEPKMNFYYPGEYVVDPDEGIGGAVVPGTGGADTPAATSSLPKPKTRKEYYLAAIAGEDVVVPEPKTRQEHYLKEIANKPAPSGGDGGIFPVTTTITVTVIPGEMERYSYSFSDANHTVTEISEALTENKLPVLFATEVLEEESIVSVWYFSHIDNDGTIIFERLNDNGSHIYVRNGNKVDGAFMFS